MAKSRQTTTGQRIRALREAAGLSILQLQERTGVGRKRLTRLEADEPGGLLEAMSAVQALAVALGVTVGQLFAGAQEK